MSPWTLANITTIARLGILPMVVFLIWPSVETRETCFWAAMLYSLAGALDMVDGAIARRYNQVTVLGKFLDPLVDKLFHLVTLIALLQLPGPRVPPWVVMLFLARELAITGLRAIAASEGVVIAAGEGGKAKTAFATLGTASLLIHYSYLLYFGWITVPVSFHRVGLVLTYISVGYAVASGAGYARGFIKNFRLQTQDLSKPRAGSDP